MDSQRDDNDFIGRCPTNVERLVYVLYVEAECHTQFYNFSQDIRRVIHLNSIRKVILMSFLINKNY